MFKMLTKVKHKRLMLTGVSSVVLSLVLYNLWEQYSRSIGIGPPTDLILGYSVILLLIILAVAPFEARSHLIFLKGENSRLKHEVAQLNDRLNYEELRYKIVSDFSEIDINDWHTILTSMSREHKKIVLQSKIGTEILNLVIGQNALKKHEFNIIKDEIVKQIIKAPISTKQEVADYISYNYFHASSHT